MRKSYNPLAKRSTILAGEFADLIRSCLVIFSISKTFSNIGKEYGYWDIGIFGYW